MPMIVSEAHLRREVVSFLASLRFSVDNRIRKAGFFEEEERERNIQALLLIEEARIRFIQTIRPSLENSEAEWLDAISKVQAFLDRFVHSKIIDGSLFDRRFRLSPMPTRERESLTPFLLNLHEAEGISVSDAIVSVRKYLDLIADGLRGGKNSLDFSQITKIVPPQQIAPVQFEIASGKISVSTRAPITMAEDAGNINASLEYLQDSGKKLIENLTNSNCDKRLLENVIELHQQISDGKNIVKIGLTNMACSVMGGKFAEELPDAVSAMFSSYNSAVSLYVSQFPEWEQFIQKSTASQIDAQDIQIIDQAADTVIAELQKNSDVVEDDVPKTIEFVRDMLRSPGTTSTRAAFALVKTFENLISVVVRHSAQLVGQTIEKTKEKLASAMSMAIVGYLSIALASATAIGPSAMRIGAPWVQQVIEVLQKQIEKVAK